MWKIWVRRSFSKINTLTNSIDFIPNEHLEQKHWTNHSQRRRIPEREKENTRLLAAQGPNVHMWGSPIWNHSLMYVSLRWTKWDVYLVNHAILQVLLKRTSAWLPYSFLSMTNVYWMELIQCKTISLLQWLMANLIVNVNFCALFYFFRARGENLW